MKYILFLTKNIIVILLLHTCFVGCSLMSKSACTPQLASGIGGLYHQSLFDEEAFKRTIKNNRDYYNANGACIKCMEELSVFFNNASLKFYETDLPTPPGATPTASGFEIWALELKWLSKTIPKAAGGNWRTFNENPTKIRIGLRLALGMVREPDPLMKKQLEEGVGGIRPLIATQFVFYEEVMNW